MELCKSLSSVLQGCTIDLNKRDRHLSSSEEIENNVIVINFHIWIPNREREKYSDLTTGRELEKSLEKLMWVVYWYIVNY